MLSARSGLDVVATVSDGIEAIARVKLLTPDLAIIDDAMPGATGLEVVGEARRWSPGTRFVILTGRASPARLSEMLVFGVSGILLKSMAPDTICDAIEAVAQGREVIAPEIARQIDNYDIAQSLTPRERQVLEGIARGLSNSAIGAHLGVSAKTIDSHRTRLMRKLGAHSIAQLLLLAVRHGLIEAR